MFYLRYVQPGTAGRKCHVHNHTGLLLGHTLDSLLFGLGWLCPHNGQLVNNKKWHISLRALLPEKQSASQAHFTVMHSAVLRHAEIPVT